jgi:hypothetical protein
MLSRRKTKSLCTAGGVSWEKYHIRKAEHILQTITDVTKQLLQNLRFSRRWLWRVASTGMLRRVALVRTDVSEEVGASFIRETRIGELGTTLAVTSDRHTLRRNTNFLTRATRRNIPEDAILSNNSSNADAFCRLHLASCRTKWETDTVQLYL